MTAAVVDRPAVDVEPVTRPQKRQVVHLYWTSVARFCQEQRLPAMRYLCGRLTDTPRRGEVVETVGRLMAVTETTDCRTCVRVLEAYLARTA